MTLDIIENAAMALCNSHLHKGWALASDTERELYRELAGSVIVFVTPLIEAAAYERAAKVAEREEMWLGDQIAADIRALKEQP